MWCTIPYFGYDACAVVVDEGSYTYAVAYDSSNSLKGRAAEINAKRSSSIYSASSTVQPSAIQILMIIKV